jgi:dolichol-phosphate mannosyltransferase
VRARNIEEGGSLTILATALVDTGSRMDEYIFEEFKGTGNMDLVLDRNLFDQRIFPAIDINKSGTRRDDLLLSKEDLAATFHLRRTLAQLDNDKAITLLIDRLRNTKTNADFMQIVSRSATKGAISSPSRKYLLAAWRQHGARCGQVLAALRTALPLKWKRRFSIHAPEPSASTCTLPDASDDARWEIAVVVPTLNERANLPALLDGILAADPRLHVLVVDDGSRDGTAGYIAERELCEPRVHLLDRGRKLGYASAVQDGMRLAIAHGARRVVQMDADFSHHPKYLPALLKKGESCDLAIGSRYVRGGGTRNWGPHRKVLSAGANALVRTLLGLRVRDCTSGFRCWNAALIERAQVLEVRVEGYAFLFLVTDLCRRAGARIGEVPIVFADRTQGKSKMSRKIMLEGAQVLARLWVKRLRRR